MSKQSRIQPKSLAPKIPDLRQMTQQQAQTIWQRTMVLFGANLGEFEINMGAKTPSEFYTDMDQLGNIYPEIGGVARAIKSKAECKRSSLQKQWLAEAGNNKDLWKRARCMENAQFSTALNSTLTDSLKQAILETMQPEINVERTGMEKGPA